MVVRIGPLRGSGRRSRFQPGPTGQTWPGPSTPEMRRVVAANLPVRKELWTLGEAVSLFRERGWEDAALLLRTRRDHTVPLVTLGQVYALSPGPLLPSTSQIREFGLTAGPDGLLLDLGSVDPRGNGNGHGAAPSWNRHPGMVDEHRHWLGAMGVTSVGAFNESCVAARSRAAHPRRRGLPREAHRPHRRRIAGPARADPRHRIAGPVVVGQDDVHQAAQRAARGGRHPPGGPLARRLLRRPRATPRGTRRRVRLRGARGARPPAAPRPPRAPRSPARRCGTPRYDFQTGQEPPRGRRGAPLGTERRAARRGHPRPEPALLARRDPAGGALPRLRPPGDGAAARSAHAASRRTDLRLLRRIVRDRHGRAIRAADNIARWPSRCGAASGGTSSRSDGNADAVFDTSLVYELGRAQGLRRALPARGAAEHPAFPTAHRLRQLIDRFVTIYPDHVPPTSILREFIGGSGFEYEPSPVPGRSN